METLERLDIVHAVAAEAEAAAHDDRPVRPRQVELVQRLPVEIR